MQRQLLATSERAVHKLQTPPKQGLLFQLGLGFLRLLLPTSYHESEQAKATKHHGVGFGFGNGDDGNVVEDAVEAVRTIAGVVGEQQRRLTSVRRKHETEG